VLVEASGVPVGIAVDGANRNDMKLVRETLESIPVERPEPTPKQPQGMCMDKGYDYDEVRGIVDEFGFTAISLARRRDEGTEAQRPNEGASLVVERTHSWMNRFRGILIRWNKKPKLHGDAAFCFRDNHLPRRGVIRIGSYRAAGLFG